MSDISRKVTNFTLQTPWRGFQVRKTDSVNDRKGKANQLLFILLTQKPMVWEGQVRDWGHVGWLENSSTCLDASKERKAYSGSPRYHIALGSIRVQAPLQDR